MVFVGLGARGDAIAYGTHLVDVVPSTSQIEAVKQALQEKEGIQVDQIR
jgi:hypothetical protein